MAVLPPAVALMVFGGLGLAMGVLNIIVEFTAAQDAQRQQMERFLQEALGVPANQPPPLPPELQTAMGIALLAAQCAISAFVLWGGWRMKSLRGYGIAVAAAVLAGIPCLGPCCGLSLPVAVWALVVLLRPEVKQAFT